MKISEFIFKYITCPICDRKVECVFTIHLSKTFSYQTEDGTNFIKIKEENIHSRGKLKNYYPDRDVLESPFMQHSFQMKDHFNLPEGLVENLSNKKYGNASFIIECLHNDFICRSTEFNIFNKEHLIEMSSENFEVDWQHFIYNCYLTNRTTISIISDIKVAKHKVKTKEISLIPLDKWLLGDKVKMREKLEKLLVLA